MAGEVNFKKIISDLSDFFPESYDRKRAGNNCNQVKVLLEAEGLSAGRLIKLL